MVAPTKEDREIRFSWRDDGVPEIANLVTSPYFEVRFNPTELPISPGMPVITNATGQVMPWNSPNEHAVEDVAIMGVQYEQWRINITKNNKEDDVWLKRIISEYDQILGILGEHPPRYHYSSNLQGTRPSLTIIDDLEPSYD